MTVDDGGPAFPTEPKNHGYEGAEGTGAGEGMTLRDYFATQAMAQLMRGPEGPSDWRMRSSPEGRSFRSWVAEDAYLFADAMLKARKQ